MNKLKNTFTPQKVKSINYDAIFYTGGGAAMFGVPENIEIQKKAYKIYANNGIVASVCHGTAGILLINDDSGMPIIRGKRINGYPDLFENKQNDYYKSFPFSIEKKAKEQGGIFEYSNKRNSKFYIIDGKIITGQDPSSSALVAIEVVKFISSN